MKLTIIASLVASAAAFAPAFNGRSAPSTSLSADSSKVKDIIVEQLGCKPEQLVPEAKFIDDLGADSLDTVELIMALEEEYDAEIPEDEAVLITTVGDAISFVDNL
eukprot:CAMPEP_0198129866 /NCGR_PEP_ID=MMETSP1442-20131203/52679_1 /TAXON_ID= /ORGANISM="Craspedostauros australis, Strain CCMP3328" /LENGTH=105 /DNA_ID=CAMNT_0043790351 /DNA_START=18 /DNA_END=335 /DNA_ORIENTATION=-